MRLLKRIALRVVIAAKVIGQLVYDYLRRNRLLKPVGTLAALLLIITVIWMLSPDDLQKHINEREVLHIGLGFALYALFGRLLLVFERKRGRSFGWNGWYFIPLAMLLSINATNEWGIAMTRAPPDWPDIPLPWWGGDWERALRRDDHTGDDYWLRWKSVADMAAWALGALLCAWRDYFLADRLTTARQDYLARIAARRARRG